MTRARKPTRARVTTLVIALESNRARIKSFELGCDSSSGRLSSSSHLCRARLPRNKYWSEFVSTTRKKWKSWHHSCCKDQISRQIVWKISSSYRKHMGMKLISLSSQLNIFKNKIPLRLFWFDSAKKNSTNTNPTLNCKKTCWTVGQATADNEKPFYSFVSFFYYWYKLITVTI